MRATAAVAAWMVVMGCSEESPVPPERTNIEYQFRRHREHVEIAIQDLQGRWLAVEGLLTRQTQAIEGLRRELGTLRPRLEERIAALEAQVVLLQADLEEARRIAMEPGPHETVRDRLARSYEEIHCLRKRGIEEGVEAVVRRYGFESVEDWAAAWTEAARSERFEREVKERAARLCP